MDHRALALALSLGAVGGAFCTWAGMPLAWMIGSMSATALAAVAGARIAVPRGLRSTMILVLGIMLGSAFNPGMIDRIGGWSITLAGLIPYILCCIGMGMVWLRCVAGHDPITAYFTATPGGLNEMVLAGGALGGDDRVIALAHSLRIILVVFTVPVWFQIFVGYDLAARGPLGPAISDLGALDWGLLAACGAGWPIARRLGLPMAALTGPMLLSAALHLVGLTESRPPALLVGVAQVIVGAAIGCRFAGMGARWIGKVAMAAAGLTALLIGLTVGFAWLLHTITGIPITDLVLAYAPGGLAEMSLVALALHADVAFVSTHHLFRIILIVSFAPLLFGLLNRRERSRGRVDQD